MSFVFYKENALEYFYETQNTQSRVPKMVFPFIHTGTLIGHKHKHSFIVCPKSVLGCPWTLKGAFVKCQCFIYNYIYLHMFAQFMCKSMAYDAMLWNNMFPQ